MREASIIIALIGSILIALIIGIAATLLNVPLIRESLLQQPLLLIAFIISIIAAGILGLGLWLKRS